MMANELTAVKADGRTTCCNAFTSIGDGMVEYCKGCYEEVANADPAVYMLDIPLDTPMPEEGSEW